MFKILPLLILCFFSILLANCSLGNLDLEKLHFVSSKEIYNDASSVKECLLNEIKSHRPDHVVNVQEQVSQTGEKIYVLLEMNVYSKGDGYFSRMLPGIIAVRAINPNKSAFELYHLHDPNAKISQFKRFQEYGKNCTEV